jgi:hypothetical protein
MITGLENKKFNGFVCRENEIYETAMKNEKEVFGAKRIPAGRRETREPSFHELKLLRSTVAYVNTPNGRSVHGDVLVPVAGASERARRESTNRLLVPVCTGSTYE